MKRRHLLRLTAHHPCAFLLLTQLLGMLLYPFIEPTRYGAAGLGVLGTAVLFVSTLMVRRTPWLTWVSVLFALPAVLLLAAQALLDVPELRPFSAALEAVFYFYAAGSLIAYMLADTRVSADELFAAAATFTLLAWGFAYLFLLLQALLPGSFAAAVHSGQPRTWTELIYLSFALLSSTGIGDVLPISPPARALAALEMFVGVLYLAAVVARLIGLTLVVHAGVAPAARRPPDMDDQADKRDQGAQDRARR